MQVSSCNKVSVVQLSSCVRGIQALPEAQWINCDIRTFDMTVLGKFGVIMADPPWEIHQDLPYGTMADDEMRKMNIGTLQDDGVIYLWVTGKSRAPMLCSFSPAAGGCRILPLLGVLFWYSLLCSVACPEHLRHP